MLVDERFRFIYIYESIQYLLWYLDQGILLYPQSDLNLPSCHDLIEYLIAYNDNYLLIKYLSCQTKISYREYGKQI